MCADVAIHDPHPPGHNPHAHIMLTVRPLKENGTWQHKTEKEYLCMKDGEERGFTAAELKTAQAEGWEKQYQYLVGDKKVYMAPSEAEKQGYLRANKYPKSTKFGRQNPITERWNSEEQLFLWRENWATVTNKHLAHYPWIDARIDHRSHAARGLDEQPTIHEGYHARKMEAMGLVSDRCEINRQIKADNALLRELKAQIKKLTDAIKNAVPELANALESLRENMIVLVYRISHIRTGKQKITDYVVIKHHKLSEQITTLTEDIEELKTEKTMILKSFECADDSALRKIKKNVENLEAQKVTLEQAEKKFTAELDSTLERYKSLEKDAVEVDADELNDARIELRTSKELSASSHLQKIYGNKYDYDMMRQSKLEVKKILGEDARKPFIKQTLLRKKPEVQITKAPKEKQRNYER